MTAWVWPESSPTPNYPLIIKPRFQTDIVTLGGGGEQRRKNWLYPKFDVIANYNIITSTEAQTLYQFFIARQGRYEPFYIYDLSLLAQHSFAQDTALYCGTGNGTTATFDIPGRSTSSQSVYFDDTLQSSGFSYSYGTGDAGNDQIVFSPTAPPKSVIVTAKFTGYLCMYVRFKSDEFPRELLAGNYYSYGSIEFEGLKPL